MVEIILQTEAHVFPGKEPHLSRPPVRAISLGLLAASSEQFDNTAESVNHSRFEDPSNYVPPHIPGVS